MGAIQIQSRTVSWERALQKEVVGIDSIDKCQDMCVCTFIGRPPTNENWEVSLL